MPVGRQIPERRKKLLDAWQQFRPVEMDGDRLAAVLVVVDQSGCYVAELELPLDGFREFFSSPP